jgi:nucleotide-binding universal stress UspA family protein
MADLSWIQGPPKTILLATDLSARCDRATDRAAELANLWGARLVVLNVLEFDDEEFLESRRTAELPSWRQPRDREAAVSAQLRRDLGEDLRGMEIRIEHGPPAATIDAVARDINADLIIVGVARNETLGRYFLGSTVERLARQTPIPLLVVKSRVRPYGEILVATDFSPPSQHALTAAARFFAHAPLTLLHAWEVPFRGLLDSPNFRQEWTAMEKRGCDKFVAESGLSRDQQRDLQVLLEHGSAETIIRSYMLDKGVDLIVVGTHGRSGLFDVRLGGTAKRILEAAPGDVLLIREPRSVRAPGARPRSKKSAAVG